MVLCIVRAVEDGVYGGGTINPTLLNSWEGAYFNFNAATLIGMINDAADMGLEMFVLDDGWFGNGEYARNNDKAGLGDWELNTKKLPEGIDYIAAHALMYVSQDKRRAVVFDFILAYESREIYRTLRLDGLNPDLRYKVNELNVDKSCWWGSGDTFTGDFLMNGGFNPYLYKTYSSAIFYLEAV